MESSRRVEKTVKSGKKKEIGEKNKKVGYYSHFSSFVYLEEPFCQTGHENSSSSIRRAVGGAKP
jgi:hypothetical protein